MQELEVTSGLYVPQLESDSCGTGLIANLNGIISNSIVTDALTILECMEHRGACGCEPNSGDGAGILTHIPDTFYRSELAKQNIVLPAKGKYGVAMIFFTKEEDKRSACKKVIQSCLAKLNLNLLGYRDVPVDNSSLGATAVSTEPFVSQLFVSTDQDLDPKSLDRKLFIARNFISHSIKADNLDSKSEFYICSFSSRTIVHKGQLTSHQVREYYPDLSNKGYESAIALVHSRFSTNTFPKWKLAQPFRCISHNGEINTIVGNTNWWKAREKFLQSNFFTPEEIEWILPICDADNSDSASFDNVLEFLYHSGRSMPHTLMMMIPEAWQNDPHIDQYKKDFYEYHEGLMEPWDGPASICFTDGTVLGATLDRNGLRPSRYILTKDNVLILGSEAGTLPIDPASIVLKDRLQPGKILIADLDQNRILSDEELKSIICQNRPYGEWLQESKTLLDDYDLTEDGISVKTSLTDITIRQNAYGFTLEDEELLVDSMISNSSEPIGSMGADIPLAILSKIAQHPSHYFRQQFAQVTNPPIDPLREAAFMTLHTHLGSVVNVLQHKTNQLKYIPLSSPVLTIHNFNILRNLVSKDFNTSLLKTHFSRDYQAGDLKRCIENICLEVEAKIAKGYNVIILSNVGASEEKVPVPSLLSTGAVHQHLIKKGLRQKISLIVDGSDIIETHHFATLLSYGADAIFPRLAYLTVKKLALVRNITDETAEKDLLYNYRKAVNKGLLKVMSKLGISTVLSYKGAQTFEALGLNEDVIDLCFKGTVSRIKGMTFDMLAKEAIVKHDLAFKEKLHNQQLQDVGIYQWKRRGEYHLFNPTTIHLLQHSTKFNDYSIYKKYTEAINNQENNACTLRSLFEFKERTPISIDEVEPIENILKRFATGAMSFGSISHEAHSTLAIALNRIGGKSNSGEGGEDEARYTPKKNGDWERSAIKQVASGRFGATINYLTNASELQIKMAQGAKPGEGGQLPGHKVNEWIARVRHSTPGVGLISPPPHHDIYSIEDLAQLIFDLKNANREARISVKLVSKAGVGIIATGVTKGHADHILIAGHDGGTGASPLSSIRHAGLPWELGLAETHQTLIKNRLRDRVTIQADGQIRTGRDLAIATLLGAEEWGIATAALVVEGCILMRKCHLNTCPVGIATQDEELRKKFDGKVEHVVNFFRFLAQDLREIMASLGFRSINEMVGKADIIKKTERPLHWKLQNVDLSPIFYRDPLAEKQIEYKNQEQDHGIDDVLDRQLIDYAQLALGDVVSIQSIFPVKNTDRAVGTMLSNEIAKLYGSKGLPNNSINFRFRGSAGQSFGAFGAKGLTFTLEGESNDYFGKGLSGAKLIIVPDRNAQFEPDKNIIVGNVGLYGATSGEVYIKGKGGERFCVRNSGALAVVEGIGAHGCEYMTGGRVVILGDIDRNFGAGMSGGIAYIYSPDKTLDKYLNKEMILVEHLDKSDRKSVRKMVRKHFRYTGSLKALEILQNWQTNKANFVKIIPTEYKAILQKTKEAAALEDIVTQL